MKAQIISFQCTLKNAFGTILSSTFNQDIMTGPAGDQEMLRGLAVGMQDLRTGERRRICLTAEQAYGFYDLAKVVTIDRADLPRGEALGLGDRVWLKLGQPQGDSFRIAEVKGETLVLDANHPYAGQDLIFEIETIAARDATPDEVSDSAGGAGQDLH